MHEQQQNLYPNPNLHTLTNIKSNKVYNSGNKHMVMMSHGVISYSQKEREEYAQGDGRDEQFGPPYGTIKSNKRVLMDGGESWVRSGSFNNSHNSGKQPNYRNGEIQLFKHDLLDRPNTKYRGNETKNQERPIVQPIAKQQYRNKSINKMRNQKEPELKEINKHFNNDSEQQQSDFVGGQEIQLAINKKGNTQQEQLYENFGLDRHKVQNQLIRYEKVNSYTTKNIKTNRQSSNSPKLRHRESDNPSQFIDSRQSLMKSYPTKYGPGGIQTLQFNPQKQKFIILDSKETENLNINPYNSNIIDQFCQNIIIPPIDHLPSPENTPQQLVTIGKNIFTQFGCKITEQIVINVKKYRNCVYFSIDGDNNILYHYENGKLYYGGWKMMGNGEGQKYGEGVEILPGKYKFKGYFVEGKKSGFGTLIGYDGSAYAGQWENGFKHGSGRQLDSDGIIYEGEWKQGKRSGYGKLINNGRLEFEGVFSKGLKNGYGKQYFQNGDTYDGNYSNHKFQGKGTYSWHSGASYTGQFKYGKRNGYGIWKSGQQNYDSYQGQYVDDKKHGHGVYRWSNGAVYDGEFREDLKHGQGTIVYENGKIAKLVWKNGRAEKKIQTQDKDKREEMSNSRSRAIERKIGARNSSTSSQPNLYIPLQPQPQSTSQAKTNNFILRSRPSSRSTQNLHSATSNSTRNSHPYHQSHQQAPKGLTFHTRTNTKNLRIGDGKAGRREEDKVIRLKFDNNQFEKAIGKNWNKGLMHAGGSQRKIGDRPELPKDRPYRGIQNSASINMEL